MIDPIHVLSRERKEPSDDHTQKKLICSQYTHTQQVSMAGVGGGDAGQCEFNWIKVSALHSKVHVCCPPPLIHEANTPSRIPPLTNVILAVEVTLKSIRIRSLDGIVLEKDATATYCCPHCFSSFRRRNSRSQRKKKLPGRPDPPPLHPTLIRKAHDLRCEHIWLGSSFTHSTSHHLLHGIQGDAGERQGAKQEPWRRLGLGLLRRTQPSQKVCRESHARSAPFSLVCSIAALSAAGRLLRSRLWLRCSLPTASIRSNTFNKWATAMSVPDLRGRDWKRISSVHSLEKKGRWMNQKKRNQIWGWRCPGLLFTSLLCRGLCASSVNACSAP